MGDTKKHHFIPRFFLKQWTCNNDRLWLYLKKDVKNSPKLVSTWDVGCEKNLYTSTGGDKSIETDFFCNIDAKACNVLNKILKNNNLCLQNDEKEDFTHFIETLYMRTPETINMIRDFSKKMNGGRKTTKYDDIPKVIKIYSTIGESTEMSKLYENDFEKIMSAEWRLYENKSNFNLITSDNPLEVNSFSNDIDRKEIFELPEKFGIMLALSPYKILIICNEKKFFDKIELIPQKEFVKKVNINNIKRANCQIYANEKSLNDFIINNI